jgi:DNA-binding CsgD family transcriptional regulator
MVLTATHITRHVALAIDPAVMPAVKRQLATAGITLGGLQGGEERARLYTAVCPGEPIKRLPPAEVAAAHKITPRQLRILQLIADGHTYAEIGERLDLAGHNAKHWAQDMYRRIGANSAPHAVLLGYRLGLLIGGA